jgi:membrane protein
MKHILHRLYRAIRRVFPDCVTQTQAVAFNMFLAFFPMTLIVMGTIASSQPLRAAFLGGLARLRPFVPPGSLNILSGVLARYSTHPYRWVALGMSGTLLAGTQMMKLLMEGFCLVHNDRRRHSLLSLHLRALLLLIITIAPSMLTVNLVVFGKQVRAWMLHISSMSVLIRLIWSSLYVWAALTMGLVVLAIIYRVGRPGARDWSTVIPGAVVATLLWWPVSAALGFYLRHVPYSLVYGGVAVAIGLMIWMQITASILLIGAAYNAEIEFHTTDFPHGPGV